VKLRARLALTVLVAAAPLLALASWAREAMMLRAREQSAGELLLEEMEAGGLSRCERDPAAFGGPGPLADGAPALLKVERSAFDLDFRSMRPGAPEFPPKLREALARGRQVASVRMDINGRPGAAIAVRVAPGGPCAIVLVRRENPLGRGLYAPVWVSLAPLVALLFAVLAAAGPVVHRIRLLGADVRKAAASRYTQPVDARGDDEIAELARAFNDAEREVRAHIVAVEQRDEALRSFVSNTTHDVMLPLTALLGHLTDLKAMVSDAEAPANTLLAALQEAHYMASLLRNLEAAAKLEVGEPELRRHPVSLNDVLERAVGRHRPIARHLGVAIEAAAPPDTIWILGDLTLLEQAIGNLIDNAVRYNQRGGHVAAVLDPRSGGREFSLRVIDDGPGIPEGELARLTERHFRGEAARSRRPEGRGLGLHITRRVAERHGFSIHIARSTYGGLEVELVGAASPRGGEE
jgi:signal transduction histidine kinase